MASIFAGNSYSYYRSLHQFNRYKNLGSLETVDINKFNYLYNNALITLQTDVTNFGNGNFDKLNDFKSRNYIISLNAASLIGDKYNTPDITKLTNYEYDPTMFNRYRQIFINIVQGLDNAIVVNTKLNETVKEQAKEIDMLKNMPLEDYIIKQPKMTNLYTETNVDIQSSELLPWFSEYLFQYGPPTGAFDPNLLAVIVDTQIKKGLYTVDYFLSSEKIVPL
jgi:hypothetical protein